MATETTNYDLLLPVPLSPIDANVWGGYLNSNTTFIDGYFLSLAGNFYGSTQPTIPATSTPTNGQFWVNNTNASLWLLSVYDGSTWVQIGTINPISHVFSASRGGGANPVQFFGGGTYTPSAGISYAIIECWGGGGGGGGYAGNITQNGGAGGGGAGGYSRTYASLSAIGASQAVLVGGPGSAGPAGANNGGAGGFSSVGSLCVANGGLGGIGSPGGSAPGGLGGAASTGNMISSYGAAGGTADGGTNSGEIGLSGFGGNSIVGAGGQAIRSGPGSVNNGVAGLGYGAGGSGASGATTTLTATGGAGTPGYVLITEYF
jgi:hypothetical protein